MASAADDRIPRPQLREGLLLLGFAVVLALALVTVVLPELSREPDSTSGVRPAQATGAGAKTPTPSN